MLLAAKDRQQETCLRMLPATFVLKKCIIPPALRQRGLAVLLTTKYAQQETCGDGGADNAGHVGTHSVH